MKFGFEKAPKKKPVMEPAHVFDTEDGELKIYEAGTEHRGQEPSILISPGFTQGSETSAALLNALGNEHHTFMPYLPTGRPSAVRERQLWSESPVQQGKAMTHIDALEKMQIDRVDAVGHSEGAVNLVMAAALYPEKFRSIVLINPGGLVGEDSIATLGPRFTQHKAQLNREFAKDPALKAADDVGKIERDNNFTRDLLETVDRISDLAGVRMEEIMAIAKAHGVKIAIIHTKDDLVYPFERVQEMNQRYREQLKLDQIEPETTVEDSEAELIDKFYEYDGTHVDFYVRPELYGRYIERALEELNSAS